MQAIFCKFLLLLIFPFAILNCKSSGDQKKQIESMKQADIKNHQMKSYTFLKEMYADSYFPAHLVDKCKFILIELCITIEANNPKKLKELYALSHEATEKINDLEEEFFENGSEIETAARECIGKDFEAISKAYGFEADVEELIAPRNW